MLGRRGIRRRSRHTERRWAIAAIAVSVCVGAGMAVANSHHASWTQPPRTAVAAHGEPHGAGGGGYAMMPGPGQQPAAGEQVSTTARRQLSARWETSKQWWAWYKRWHSQQSQDGISAAGSTHPSTAPPAAAAATAPAATPTATVAAASAETGTGVTRAASQNWAGYAATGRAGKFTSVAADWTVPTVTCADGTTRSRYWVGLDGDGTSTIERIGTEGDCAGVFQAYSGWFQVSPHAPVVFKKPVKPGDSMAASVTALGAGTFMLTLYDMTQNWSEVTRQTSSAAALGSAEIVVQAPRTNGKAQRLANFGIVDFLGAAVNNAAITSPVSALTMKSADGVVLAVPSMISGGVGNFSVGWDNAGP